MQLRWLNTENLKITKQGKVVVFQVKISSKQKHTKLGWFASDINFKPLHTGCPIAHGNVSQQRSAFPVKYMICYS